MVLPVTGPFTKTVILKGQPISTGYRPNTFYKFQQWSKQKRPYDRPLAYQMDVRFVDSFVRPDNSNYADYTQCPSYSSGDKTAIDAQARAYAKFVDQIGEQAQWVNNLIEMRHADSVIFERASQLLKFSRAVRRFDGAGAARALGLGKHSVALSRKNTFSQNWLRYHFGVEPLMKDIHASCEVFDHDFSPKRIVGRGFSRRRDGPFRTDRNSTSYTTDDYDTSTRCLIGAEVRISNPNLYLMRTMGVINPLSIAWEAVPFSFVVDWFANVGQVLASITDLYGCTLSGPFTTYYQTATHSQLSQYGLKNGDPKKVDQLLQSYVLKGAFMRRGLSVAGPSLYVKPFRGISPVRGATAIALLFNFLKR